MRPISRTVSNDEERIALANRAKEALRQSIAIQLNTFTSALLNDPSKVSKRKYNYISKALVSLASILLWLDNPNRFRMVEFIHIDGHPEFSIYNQLLERIINDPKSFILGSMGRYGAMNINQEEGEWANLIWLDILDSMKDYYGTKNISNFKNVIYFIDPVDGSKVNEWEL